jgi:predicted adenylyl cyclase CyaB
MPANIEIKARSRSPARQRELAARLSGSSGREIPQVDTYFNVPQGRLKLREGGESRELIYYARPQQAGPKRSEYLCLPAADPAGLRAVLTAALGIRGVVRKTRLLFLVGQTRVHLDEVADLGAFIELEVVLAPGQSDQYGRAVATQLMEQLEIDPQDLIAESYIDLLSGGRNSDKSPSGSEGQRRSSR